MIGAYQTPELTQESASFTYGKFVNSQGVLTTAIGERLNTGINAGKFQIDFFTSNGWYLKQSWSYITTTSIYGNANDYLVCGDYDGDGKTDIGVYKPSNKTLYIDFANNSFGSWDITYFYSPFPDIDATAIPLAADYDGDHKTDISFKTSAGKWFIDYKSNGFGNIDLTATGFGDQTFHPVPADYDGDGKADLSVKSDAGDWKIDYIGNGIGTWDFTSNSYGGSTFHPVPADYDGDGKADLSVKSDAGGWLINYAGSVNGFYSGWNVVIPPGTYGGVGVNPIGADLNGDGYSDFGFIFPNGSFWIDDFHAQTPGHDFVSLAGKIGDNFNVNSLNNTDISNFSKFKNCYFNLDVTKMSEFRDYNQGDYFLTLANNIGFKTMLSNDILNGHAGINTTAFDKNDFVNHYKNLIPANLKNMLYGINLGDEPALSQLSDLGDWSTYFSQQYSELPNFANLLPRYGFNSDVDFLNYLDDYKAVSNSPFVCFDHYPFRASFVRSYFYNLQQIKNKFPDKALWSVAYSGFANDGINNPNDIEQRFMAFCPIAYGAKGILYYPYDDGRSYTNTINTDNIKYNTVQNINLYLQNIVGPVTIGSRNIATLHKANTYTNYDATTQVGYPFTNSELISNYTGIVKDVNNNNVLIGIFAKNDTTSDPKTLSVGNYYLWVVNKDTANSISNVLVTLRGVYLNNNISISPRAYNYIANPTTTYTTPAVITRNFSLKTTSFTIPSLEAGEGIMVKIFSSLNECAPADYDGDKIMDISVKEYDGTWLIDYSSNGFGNWDWWGTGYGDQTCHPVPADYDGDGKADISIKSDGGDWKIDYSSVPGPAWGFLAINAYGNQTAHPIPADYDGDGKADLSVKTDAGSWLINYAGSVNGFYSGWNDVYTGFGDQTFHPYPADYNGDHSADLCVKSDGGDVKLVYRINNSYSGWSFVALNAYGDQTAHFVPADYDGDGKVDLGVKTDAGSWLINYAAPSPGYYSGWNGAYTGFGDQYAIPLPGDYGGDTKADLSVKYPNGDWKIDYSYNGYGNWDNILLTPKLNDPILSEGADILPNTESSEKISLNYNSYYKVLSIYDLAGRIVKKVNKSIRLVDIKSLFNLPSGIYLVKLIINSKLHVEKININY